MATVIVPRCDPVESVKMLSLTPAAVQHIKKMLAKRPGKMIFRLAVKQAGCSGWSYVVDYVEDLNASDLPCCVGDDLTIFVDKPSIPHLKGSCIDYVQNGLNGSLKFINPNQTAACGCGESFSVEEN